jgi:hypothetical protein
MSKLDVLRYSLRSLETLALLHNVQIPPDALQYFQDLEIDDTVLENVPITLMTAELPPLQTSELASSFERKSIKLRSRSRLRA